MWERIDEYRVFYDVDEAARRVNSPSHPAQAAAQDDGGDPVKTVELSDARWEACVDEAQDDQVLLTRGG